MHPFPCANTNTPILWTLRKNNTSLAANFWWASHEPRCLLHRAKKHSPTKDKIRDGRTGNGPNALAYAISKVEMWFEPLELHAVDYLELNNSERVYKRFTHDILMDMLYQDKVPSRFAHHSTSCAPDSVHCSICSPLVFSHIIDELRDFCNLLRIHATGNPKWRAKGTKRSEGWEEQILTHTLAKFKKKY